MNPSIKMVLRYVKTPIIKTYYPTKELIGHIFAFGRIGCLDKNMKIKIINEKGKEENKKIKDLDNSFRVISRNRETEVEEIKNAKKVNSGKKSCLKITFGDGSSIIATKEHRFFTPFGKEVCVGDLKIDDRLLRRF